MNNWNVQGKKKNLKHPILAQDDQKMIQMEDLSYMVNPYAEEPRYYRTLQDQPNYGMIKKEIKGGRQQYIYPSMSITKTPNEITMNGSVFRINEPIHKPKKKKLPQMDVFCKNCNTAQKVPGNALLFDCYNCQQISTCEPTYGIFICGDCQAHVCYQYATSQLIKCTKCGTINKVPMMPKRKALKNKPQKKKKVVKNVQQQSQVRFDYPIYAQSFQEDFAEKPRNSIREDYDELEFEDNFPSLNEKSQVKYPII